MHNRSGVLLLDLVISMALAAIISFTLVNTLYRANKASGALDNSIFIYSHAALAHYQLERDITTAFAPILEMVSTEKQADTAPEKNPEKSAEQQTAPGRDKQKESLKKVFYGTHDTNNNLSTLTCITTSPLAIYWSAKAGKPKARVARVIYRLVKDTHKPDTYTLMRQEGQELDFDKYAPDREGQARSYPLIKNIKQLTVTYKISREKETPATPESSETSKTPPEIEYKTLSEWGVIEESEKSKKEGEESLPPLPHMVTVLLTLWNKEHTREHTFNFVYVIAAQSTIPEKKAATSKNKTPQTNKPAKTNQPISRQITSNHNSLRIRTA